MAYSRLLGIRVCFIISEVQRMCWQQLLYLGSSFLNFVRPRMFTDNTTVLKTYSGARHSNITARYSYAYHAWQVPLDELDSHLYDIRKPFVG